MHSIRRDKNGKEWEQISPRAALALIKAAGGSEKEQLFLESTSCTPGTAIQFGRSLYVSDLGYELCLDNAANWWFREIRAQPVKE